MGVKVIEKIGSETFSKLLPISFPMMYDSKTCPKIFTECRKEIGYISRHQFHIPSTIIDEDREVFAI